jgi:hypothetical protein
MVGGEAAERVLLDSVVAAGLGGRRRAVVTDRAFYDGGQPYPFHAITSLAHQVTRFHGKSGRTMNFVYNLWIATGDKARRVYWSGSGPHERAVYDAVVEALHRYVTPRIVRELVQRMAGGETVEIGSLRMTSDGIARKKTLRGVTALASWSPRIRMVAKDGDLFVYDGDKHIAAVSVKTPNAAVLPALVDAMGSRDIASAP